ncbi:MAG: hypothetical protein JRJ49_02245 [Deltaproteobacteria bacterium]|nr:hypothetical protein [Deltaproteobacteria bacterium]
MSKTVISDSSCLIGLSKIGKLEKEINNWLDNNNNIEIKHIKQNYAFDNNEDKFYSLVSIWYI